VTKEVTTKEVTTKEVTDDKGGDRRDDYLSVITTQSNHPVCHLSLVTSFSSVHETPTYAPICPDHVYVTVCVLFRATSVRLRITPMAKIDITVSF
jgi:hypothetical protein